ALARERAACRLVVRALHEADRGPERQQAGQILRGAAQIGLQTDAHAPSLGPHPAEQLERDVDVARLLHVDPQERAALGGPARELADRPLAGAAIDLETEGP